MTSWEEIQHHYYKSCTGYIGNLAAAIFDSFFRVPQGSLLFDALSIGSILQSFCRLNLK